MRISAIIVTSDILEFKIFKITKLISKITSNENKEAADDTRISDNDNVYI